MGTVADLLVGLWWGFGLLAELRPLVLAGAIFGLFIQELREFSRIFLFFALIIVNLFWLTPFFAGSDGKTNADVGWGVVHVAWGGSTENVADFVQNSGGDLVFVQELQPWLSGVGEEIEGYEAVLINALENTHGVGVWVREGRAVEAEVLIITEVSQRPLIVFETAEFVGMSVHVTRPRSQSTFTSKTQELEAVKQWVNAQTKPVILIGDFNATPWTMYFQDFLRESDLSMSRHGGTWPAFMPTWLSLPIDHALIAEELVMIDQTVGFLKESDHRPLMIWVGLDE